MTDGDLSRLPLLDHLVGECEQHMRHIETERHG
jgi:hypothetical protein